MVLEISKIGNYDIELIYSKKIRTRKAYDKICKKVIKFILKEDKKYRKIKGVDTEITIKNKKNCCIIRIDKNKGVIIGIKKGVKK